MALQSLNKNDQIITQQNGFSSEAPRSAKGDNSTFLKAVRGGDVQTVEEFLNSGKVDVHASNNNGLNALHLSAKDGYIDIVNILLHRECPVDSKSKKGNTPLHVASLAGQMEVVVMLVDNGADVNMQSQAGFTPLYMASQENHAEVVSYLLERGANPAIATEDNYTPMAVAVQQNNREVVEVLVEHEQRGKTRLSPLHLAAKKNDVHSTVMLLQSEPNPNLRIMMVNDTTKSGFTPLHIASHYGNLNVAKILIQHGSNVNAKAKSSIYPLHVSSKWGRGEVVELLLRNNANVDCRTKDNLTPLHCCSRSGFERVVDILLHHGADISSRTKHGLTPLHMAAQGDHSNTARMLLASQAPFNDVTVDLLTPLHVAAHCGSYNCAKVLLDNSCEPNSKALNGFTPLHIACKKNRTRVIELLLQYGATVDCVTETGLTSLHVASFMGYTDIVKLLLSRGSDIKAQTDKGETCLHLATRGNQLEVMEVLVDRGADVDARAKENQTPLHSAARTGSTEAVGLLVRRGAQVDAVTNDSYTPLHAAAKEGHCDVIQLLLDQGADQCIKTLKSFTPLHIASKYGNAKAGEVLLSNGGDIDVESSNGLTPLHLSAHYNQPYMAQVLLSRKANPLAAARNGYTPLHIASKYNEVDIAAILLDHRAKPNAESKNGFTPLHLAAQEGHMDLLGLLLERRGKVGHQSRNGLTCMHLAAQEDHLPVAQTLVSYKAEIDPKTKAGYTPLHTACHFGKLNMIDFLLRHGADVQAATRAGYTPLHQAAQQGHVLVTQMLLKHSAHPDAVTSDGKTPLWIADQLGYISVQELLADITTVQSAEESEDRYKLLEPETMHDAPMSDEEDDEKGDLAEQSYMYLTTNDDMKGFGDDSTHTNRESFVGDRGSVQKAAQDDISWNHKQNKNMSSEFQAFQSTQPPPSNSAPQRHKQQDTDYVNGTNKVPEQYDIVNTKRKPHNTEYDGYQGDGYQGDGYQGDGYHGDGYHGDGYHGDAYKDETSYKQVRKPLRSEKDAPVKPHSQPPPQKPPSIPPSSQPPSLPHPSQPPSLPHPSQPPSLPPTFKVDNSTPELERKTTTRDLEKDYMEAQMDRLKAIKHSRGVSPGPPNHGIPCFKSNISETDSHVFGSTYSGMSYASSYDPDNVALSRQPIFQGFLVSFIVDARGGAMRGCRHSGIRIIVPPGRASQPTRVTCKLVKKDKVHQLPPMLESEALASRVLVMGPSGAKFLGPVVLEVPHFASLRDNQREIVVWRSDNGFSWKEHSDIGNIDVIQRAICASFDDLESAEDLYHRRITRIVSSDFPKYFALVTRLRQDIVSLGPQGGVIASTTSPSVQAVFPPGALTKPIKLCLQTQSLSEDFVKKMVGNRVSVSPIATVEPRRRKFHRPITITLPLDPALVKNNKAIDKSPSLRLLCSMNDGSDPTEWEDITGTTPMSLTTHCISFPIAVSARYWLINTPRYKEAVMLANPMFTEASVVPFMATFVVFAKRRDPLDGQLRIFCMTDDKMDKTLENQEKFIEVARSRDIEVSDERPQWIECHGNLIPVLKSDHSDRQPYINFRAFKENRLSLNVRVRDLSQEASAVLFFMTESRDVKDQQPLCTLNVALPSMDEQQKINSSNNVAELQKKLDELRNIELSEEDQISKTELRLTDIAECLEDDWTALASHLNIPPADVTRIQSQYGYVPEQALVMLHLWMERNKDVASGNVLEKALREVGREDIIQKCIYFLQDVTDENEIKEAKNVIFSSSDNPDKSDDKLKDNVFSDNNGHQKLPDATIDSDQDEEEKDDELDEQIAVRVYTDTVENDPDVETDVQEFEEVLEDGTVVRKRITKTKQKQTIIKRVVMEGPEDELPSNEEEAQILLKQVDYDDEAILATLQEDEDKRTDVQEFEEVQEDGSVVRRRIVTTTEQQLNTEKIVLEGDVSIDEDEGPPSSLEYSSVAETSPSRCSQSRV